MGKGSTIAWCTDTFNAWEGCQKLLHIPECDECYAAELASRYHPDRTLWGKGSDRLAHVEKYWQQPFTWNSQVEKTGKIRRVFGGSLMDPCDLHPTAQAIRPRLIETIEQTPRLIWQLLSKRPGLYKRFFWEHWPEHVWVMTSAGSLRTADIMLPKLIEVDASIRGVSVEPLLEYFDLAPYLPYLDWVIIGGESGLHARPMDLTWAEKMIADCQNAGVAVFFKQTGSVYERARGRGNRHGTDPQYWPQSLRVQEFPSIRINRLNPYSGLQAQWSA